MSAQTPTYDPSNIFAKILRGELPCEKLLETEHCLAFMDIMPRSPGHALVIPKRPARNLLDIDPVDLAEVHKTTKIIAKAQMAGLGSDGITIQQFNESAGGQVVFHLHVHVLPRWEGVALKPAMSSMEKKEVLAEHAAKIRAALG